MSVGNPSFKKRNLKPDKLKQVSSPGMVAGQLAKIAKLEKQMKALLQKLDNDSGVSDTNYESTTV